MHRGSAVRRAMRNRRAVAALEFALIAPVTAVLLVGVFDISRAMTAWEETCNAAQAIAQAAEKLSVPANLGQPTLNATQMQNAMSTIYAQMPGLNLGHGGGSLPGLFAVTLSSIEYLPLCQNTSGCAAQTPYTAWSSYFAEGGGQLITKTLGSGALLRACGALTAVSNFPNDATQLTKMVDPTKAIGAVPMTLTPQIVADVHYTFTPTFSMFLNPITFWASAVVPTPLGGTNMTTTFDTTPPTGNVVSCPLPS